MEHDITSVLKKVNRLHFIGIGGVSMSALALIMQSNGYTVSGSDTNRDNCTVLLDNGVTVYSSHAAENLKNTQAVVYTAAIKEDNPELSAARAAGLPCFERADLLGAIMKNYDCPIGVAGTHGKSTTTSMISCILLDGGVDPTISIGAKLPEIDSNYYIGHKDYFVFESCEYAGSFMKFFPKISVVLNIDEDHLDFYRDIDDIADAFSRYVDNTLPDGLLITNSDDPYCRRVKNGYRGKSVTFGMTRATYTPANLVYQNGYPTFDIMKEREFLCHVELVVPGEHNVMNALAAAAAADSVGINPDSISRGLHTFHGAGRRFELKGRGRNVSVIDDYSHHPSEIEATLNACRKMDFDNIVLIFQPHTYSRTKALLSQFQKALDKADHVILCDIYAAREKDDLGMNSAYIAGMLADAEYAPSFEAAAHDALMQVRENTLILTMGAGDVYKIADLILEGDKRCQS